MPMLGVIPDAGIPKVTWTSSTLLGRPQAK